MSLWQHKNIHKRHLLWAKLFGICLFSHLIFLFWVFCVYRESDYTVSISLNKKLDYSAPILFVPRGVQTQTAPTAVKPTPAKATAAAAKPATIKPITKSPAPKKAPTVMAQTVKPELPKPTPAPVVKKEDVKPIETKKETPKKEEPIPTPVKKEAAPIVPPKEAAPVAKALDIQQTIVPIIPENAHVSDNYREVEALRRHAQLQNEIINCWKPPFGVPPTCGCDISFSVSPTGTVHDVIIKKSSGVVMYDISARQALHAMTMPKWTHGKQLIINFKQ